MNLQEVFDQLSAGEFSQLSLGGAGVGVINETNYQGLLGHINLGLTALFKKFPLKEGRLSIALQPGQALYKLNSAFAVANTGSTELVKYILDTVDDPFQDDVLKIEKVLTEAEAEFPLNDGSDVYSMFTPSALQLRVPQELVTDGADLPEEMETDILTVVYRANHPKILLSEVQFDPSQVELWLPESHLEPLLYYVASRVNNPVGMANEFHAGNSYYAKYVAACQALMEEGLQVDQGSTNYRLISNGWA